MIELNFTLENFEIELASSKMVPGGGSALSFLIYHYLLTLEKQSKTNSYEALKDFSYRLIFDDSKYFLLGIANLKNPTSQINYFKLAEENLTKLSNMLLKTKDTNLLLFSNLIDSFILSINGNNIEDNLNIINKPDANFILATDEFNELLFNISISLFQKCIAVTFKNDNLQLQSYIKQIDNIRLTPDINTLLILMTYSESVIKKNILSDFYLSYRLINLIRH